MTPEQLKQWMADNGYTKLGLHQATGTSRVTINRYLNAEHKIPKSFELALRSLEKK